MKIILLSGWMQSGKDTVANILVSKYGYKRYAFADVLKDQTSNVFNIPRDLMDTDEGKKTVFHDKTVRMHLIDYGQACRAINPLCWVDPVCSSIQSETECDKFVITDWRMPNEGDEIIRRFGSDNVVTCRVQRWQSPPLVNYTENALDDYPFDVCLLNLASLDDLETRVIEQFNF